MIFESGPKILSETVQGGKRAVLFNVDKEGQAEKPSFEFLPYADYVKREARVRGLDEKMCFMVDPITKKIDNGQQCEAALLGRCVIGRNEKVPVPVDRKSATYEKARNKMLEFARSHQPERSEKDEENVSSYIETDILNQLRNEGLNDIKEVVFYTAVGTPLDYQYGIDGWIEIISQDGKKECITFDLKTGSFEGSTIQADIALRLDLDDKTNIPKRTIQGLASFMRNVVEIYQERTRL